MDLEEADLLTVFQASEQVGLETCTLNEIIIHLEQTYCQSIELNINIFDIQKE